MPILLPYTDWVIVAKIELLDNETHPRGSRTGTVAVAGNTFFAYMGEPYQGFALAEADSLDEALDYAKDFARVALEKRHAEWLVEQAEIKAKVEAEAAEKKRVEEEKKAKKEKEKEKKHDKPTGGKGGADQQDGAQGSDETGG